jgi:hypothetical protein
MDVNINKSDIQHQLHPNRYSPGHLPGITLAWHPRAPGPPCTTQSLLIFFLVYASKKYDQTDSHMYITINNP